MTAGERVPILPGQRDLNAAAGQDLLHSPRQVQRKPRLVIRAVPPQDVHTPGIVERLHSLVAGHGRVFGRQEGHHVPGGRQAGVGQAVAGIWGDSAPLAADVTSIGAGGVVPHRVTLAAGGESPVSRPSLSMQMPG